MDFFHCNSCFAQPGSNNKNSFFLTNCGHSFCEACLNRSESLCRVCGSNCKYLALSSDIPNEVKSYFLDAIKELKRVTKILLIQNKHCKIYMEEYVPKLEGKYVSAKLEIEKKRIEIENFKSSLQDKNAEIISLQKIIKKMEGEMKDMKNQFSRICQQSSSASLSLLSPPNSYISNRSPQSGLYTPKSTISSCSQQSRGSTSSQYHMNKDIYLSSPDYTQNSQEKKRPTSMEQIFRNNESITRGSSLQNILQTTNSNQMFSMTINTSPESSEDERWKTSRRGMSLTQSSLNLSTPRMRGRFF